MPIKDSSLSFFSHSRTPSLDDLEPNACHAAWQQFCQRCESGFDLSGSNPTSTTLPRIAVDMEKCAEAIDARYQASAQGLLVTRQAISDFYENRITADRIQLFASTSEAIGALLKLFCAPGDEVVTCVPTYPLLDCLTSLESVNLREIQLQDCAGIWNIDFWALDQVCCEKTRAILAVSPNNPTGHCISCAELDKLAQFCAIRHTVLIVDEVFGCYLLGETTDEPIPSQPACARFDQGLVISLSGLSKVCGLPQHKLGWACFGGDAQIVEEAMQRLSFITDSTLSVSGWVQRMAPYYLTCRKQFSDPCNARIRRNYQMLRSYAATHDVQWTVDRADGGWSICVRLPGWADDESVATFLAQNGVRVFPGCFFGYRSTQPTLVVSLITEPDIFDAGIEKMAELLAISLNA